MIMCLAMDVDFLETERPMPYLESCWTQPNRLENRLAGRQTATYLALASRCMKFIQIVSSSDIDRIREHGGLVVCCVVCYAFGRSYYMQQQYDWLLAW